MDYLEMTERFCGRFDELSEYIKTILMNPDYANYLERKCDVRTCRGSVLNSFGNDMGQVVSHDKGVFENVIFDDNALYKIWTYCSDSWDSWTHILRYVEKIEEGTEN